jgi:hypothetical protein
MATAGACEAAVGVSRAAYRVVRLGASIEAALENPRSVLPVVANCLCNITRVPHCK